MGSSPRVRGSPNLFGMRLAVRGIIPAGAGLTSVHASLRTRPGDHPRGCGAHALRRLTFRACRGSSPRVRGSHGDHTKKDGHVGIIPAGAGLTPYHRVSGTALWDHPRGCGAH